jgi:hypothetical protein
MSSEQVKSRYARVIRNLPQPHIGILICCAKASKQPIAIERKSGCRKAEHSPLNGCRHTMLAPNLEAKLLDYSRLSAMLAGLLGGTSIAQAMTPSAASLEDVLHNVGVDPSSLSGLTPAAVQQLLADHGIDPSTVVEGQIEQLFTNLGLDAQGIDAISALWSDGSPNGHE